MEIVNKEKEVIGPDNTEILELQITNIHAEDGYAYARKQIQGKRFNATLTLTSTGHPGWYTVVGTFKDKVGITEIDNATAEHPIVIAMAQYTL